MRRLPAATGAVLAAATIALHFLTGREVGVAAASVLVGMIGAVYIGFALVDGRFKAIVIESLVGWAFGAAALAGLLWSPAAIVAALLAHGVWDLVHHRPGALAATPGWYVPFCAVYDVLAAAGLWLVWFGPLAAPVSP